MKSCKDHALTQKSIATYPNNESYLSKEIKECVVKRKVAFKNGDLLSMKNMQVPHKLRTARRKDREKLESYCSGMNTTKLWDSMKTVTNMTPAKRCISVLDQKEKANEPNNSRDFSQEKKTAMDAAPESGPGVISIDQHAVARLFFHTSAPERPLVRVAPPELKSCGKELAQAWCPFFQESRDTHSVPSSWKSSVIIPVPRKASCKENNDDRPVALTLLRMK